jgi:succinate dehydrogenase / fumarate reductase cytochrome b subunit
MSGATLTLKDTTIGKKAIMAVTGVIMVGFVFAHMAGNLQAYAGAKTFNAYAAFLHSMPGLLWVARLVLIGSVVLHVWAALSLVRLNRKARPVRYQQQQTLATTYAAKVMPLGGIILLLFIIFHILHLTVGAVGLEFRGWQDAYFNFVSGFQNVYVSGIYVLANIFLGMHLFHGVWSMMQTLGLSHGRYNGLRKKAALGLAVLVAGANVSFPIAVLAGVIK